MKNLPSWTLIAIVILVAALPRIIELDAFTSPDEPQWEKNTIGFREALLGHDYNQFYQQPHPGITTTWLGAFTIESEKWGVKRLPLALAVALLIGLITQLSIRLWTPTIGFAIGLLLALNPHLIAHSRVLAMDALLSVCITIALLAYLLWRKTTQENYLILSGIASSLAVLSKMSGATVVLFLLLILVIHIVSSKHKGSRIRPLLVYVIAGILTSVTILPTLISDPRFVWEGTKAFFATEHYSQTVHALGPYWYPQAVAIWSTPLNWLAILALPFLFIGHKKRYWNATALVIYLLIFFLSVQYSIKKGDRYLLPDFVLFDVITVISLAAAASYITHTNTGNSKKAILGLGGLAVSIAAVWQLYTVTQLHPHYLAYRNPWTRSLTVNRTMGWGEGLDIASTYLNQKPDAQNMLIISYYESSFAYHSISKVTSAERLAKETAEEIGADYVVLYRTMQGRAPERWETKVLAEYATKTPEHIISLNGEEYVWIYKVK